MNLTINAVLVVVRIDTNTGARSPHQLRSQFANHLRLSIWQLKKAGSIDRGVAEELWRTLPGRRLRQ